MLYKKRDGDFMALIELIPADYSFQMEKISKLKHEGVYLLKEAKRYYPYKNLLSHSLGYVGIDNQGLSGLELEYNKPIPQIIIPLQKFKQNTISFKIFNLESIFTLIIF